MNGRGCGRGIAGVPASLRCGRARGSGGGATGSASAWIADAVTLSVCTVWMVGHVATDTLSSTLDVFPADCTAATGTGGSTAACPVVAAIDNDVSAAIDVVGVDAAVDGTISAGSALTVRADFVIATMVCAGGGATSSL